MIHSHNKKQTLQKLSFTPPNTQNVHGKLSINLLLWIQIPLLFFIPFITYWIAITKKQQKPFPHVTITATACPTPQNILFRFGMLTAGAFLSLLFFILLKWAKMQSIRIKYPGRDNSWLYPISQFSILCYAITIGTIDSNGTGNLHGVCAVIFFLIQFMNTIVMTLQLKDMRNWDTSVMTPRSWFLKKLTCGYLVIVWIYSAIGIVLGGSKKQDDYVDIIEWNSVSINLLWVLSFVDDWQKVYLCLKGPEIRSKQFQRCEILNEIQIENRIQLKNENQNDKYNNYCEYQDHLQYNNIKRMNNKQLTYY